MPSLVQFIRWNQNQEESEMDIAWLVAGAAFFVVSYGLVRFFDSLRAED
jgi:hypothetical protein